MNTVPILFTFDQSLEMPAGVAITSLLENAAPETFYDIFILHNPGCDFIGSPLNRLPEIYRNCRMTFRKVEGEFVGSYEIRGIPETAYYRLISPEIIPEYEKILYSDVDVVFREDLSTFYNIDLKDNYFAGVDNCSRLRPDVRDYIKGSLGLDWQNGYFYSGNLVINSALLLKDGKRGQLFYRETIEQDDEQRDRLETEEVPKENRAAFSTESVLLLGCEMDVTLDKMSRMQFEQLVKADKTMTAETMFILDHNIVEED